MNGTLFATEPASSPCHQVEQYELTGHDDQSITSRMSDHSYRRLWQLRSNLEDSNTFDDGDEVCL